jgi:hypothetical protein
MVVVVAGLHVLVLDLQPAIATVELAFGAPVRGNVVAIVALLGRLPYRLDQTIPADVLQLTFFIAPIPRRQITVVTLLPEIEHPVPAGTGRNNTKVSSTAADQNH